MLNNPYINNTRKVCESVTATQTTDNIYHYKFTMIFYEDLKKRLRNKIFVLPNVDYVKTKTTAWN